ncbi:glycine--tRNA ligase subunit beta [Candidatus Aminicenantes bacterium AC-708-M15]|nr:glycine--tRNA ligase subunit beta [SCandidatus Aminicenantes bacterium Aminicenantia_JdfR_composite]MCP2596910.1 glycine--tRNA ligase subunit beta [Candidatus Aminicenantes bacterium AC-335-G13]MCP2604224.1 glycine--tRNA ligase subunit beta [Candidatus Aminicenantes bacterium AC-708-M15]MCP2606506.1 glycine--tRNA ligase subunit beta [Candidatus Aminicenantes bacterium AC-708-I09]MCP2618811.1 glycine--tRNA ligase subunit beta [Candidatus Aminicenantes bacterium AC-335-A11]
MSEFLLEIYTEEMPSSHVKNGLEQLKNLFNKYLKENRIEFSQIKTYGTPRRLIVHIEEISKKQAEGKEQILGPPKSVAFDKDGKPTSAAEGFARSHGIKVKQLKVFQTEKGEYIGYIKKLKGKPTEDVLSQIIPQIIKSLTFPKSMKWGNYNIKFSRPIRNILCIMNGKLIEFEIENLKSTDFSFGHKTFSPHKFTVNSFKKYSELLLKNFVIIDQEQRKEIILKNINDRLLEIGAELKMDEELLEKIVFSIEYPYVFLGSFPEKYLNLPLEVTSTALKEGQNLFSVLKENKQLPYFIGVADAPEDPKDYIKTGNEKVLIARLEDAEFFWNEDRKKPMKERVKELEKIIFHEKLGNYFDKKERIKSLIEILVKELKLSRIKNFALEAAELAKVDLTTEMVKEFPNLQGKIGGLYLKEEGYPEEVWLAVYEHYQPVNPDDKSPVSLIGALISIADKTDSLVGAVGIGLEVTGSKDPFGLRRLAYGICKSIIDNSLSFSFSNLIDNAIKLYSEKIILPSEKIKNIVLEFIENRLKMYYQSQNYRYDLINASLGVGIENIYYTSLRLDALNKIKESKNFKPLIISSKRVNNIIQNQPEFSLKVNLLKEKEEKELYDIFKTVEAEVLPLIKSGEFEKTFEVIVSLRPFIDNFFDKVLVMTEDKKLRENRIALLQEISRLFFKLADFSKIVEEQ